MQEEEMTQDQLEEQEAEEMQERNEQLHRVLLKTELNVDFSDTPFLDAVSILEHTCKRSEIEVSFEHQKPEQFKKKRLNLNLTRVTLIDLLEFMTQQTGTQHQITDGKVLFRPEK